MQGVLLVAGEGSRLRPLTFTTPKPLIPLLGKPLVQYAIEKLRDAGVTDIRVVVGHLGWMFAEHFGDGSDLGVRLGYVRQEARLGIAHAIYKALEDGSIGGEFAVYLGDNYFSGPITPYVRDFLEGGYDAYIFLARHRDPTRFGYVVLRDGRVAKLVEKPRDPPPGGYTLTGLYMFRDPDLVERAYRSLKPSWRGEYEVTDLIQWFVDRGYRVGYSVVGGWWKDTGTPEDVVELLHMAMDGLVPEVRGEVYGEVVGRVVVERGAEVRGTVYGPAYLGPNALVGKGAVVEHYVDLEGGAEVASGYLSRTLVLPEARIEGGTARIVDSIIGKRARVALGSGHYRLVLGDYGAVSQA